MLLVPGVNPAMVAGFQAIFQTLAPNAGSKDATPESMTKTTPQSWTEHKRHFEDNCRTQNWILKQAKTQLMDSFKSRVADLMEDLDFAFDDDHILLETMLEAPYHTVPCWPWHCMST